MRTKRLSSFQLARIIRQAQSKSPINPQKPPRREGYISQIDFDAMCGRSVAGTNYIFLRVVRRDKHSNVFVEVLHEGGCKEIEWSSIQEGNSTGTKTFAGHPDSSRGKNGKHRSEYKTVIGHWRYIFSSRDPRHPNYKDIPFYDGWNPHKGGSIKTGMLWVLTNLGPRPNGAHLHIVPLNRGGKGFGPWRADDGGWSIRWLSAANNQKRENKSYEEHLSQKDFLKEAKRRGFQLVKRTARC